MVYKLLQFNSQIQNEEAATVLPSNSLAPQQVLVVDMPNKFMWFNPLSDIVYFGPKACFGALFSMLQSGLQIHRVAFDVNIEHQGSYSCRDWLLTEGPLCLQIHAKSKHYDYFIRKLRILHGFIPEKAKYKNKFPGCPTLNEVLLFMEEAGPLIMTSQILIIMSASRNVRWRNHITRS
jgi:hypothetical protein